MEQFSAYDIKLIEEYFKSDEEREAAKKRLAAHEPLAYILGEWGFYDQMYKVTPDCLIPRPDTEHVVDKLISLMPKGGRFLDLCTGSGCIAISALVHRCDCTADAVDISGGAVSTARYNAEKYGVTDRLKLICADICDDSFVKEKYDVIVSNPPYIRTDVIDTLQKELSYEPRCALDGGEDGMFFYRVIVSKYRKHLKENGLMIFEIGYDEADAVKALGECEIFRDYGGNDRVAVMKFR